MNELIKYFNNRYSKTYGKIAYPRTTIQIYRVYQAIKSYGINNDKLVELLHKVELPKPKNTEEWELYVCCLYNMDDSELEKKVKDVPKKTIVEDNKLYLVKSDGTKIDKGTELPSIGVSKEYVDTSLENKVDKVNGKGLSTVDFTKSYETKLKGLENYNDTKVKGDIKIINTQLGDIANKTITDEERTKLTNLENYDDTSIKNDIQVQKSRIDNLATLKAGSTTGDAELIDGRIGTDGKLYNNIGNAIRSQVSQKANQNLLDAYGLFDIMSGEKTVSKQGKYFKIDDAINGSIISVDNINNSKILIGGRNMCDLPDVSETTNNGISYSVNNGIVTLNGTSTDVVNIGIPITTNPATLEPNTGYSFTGYVLDGNTNGKIHIAMTKSGLNMIQFLIDTTGKTEYSTTELLSTGKCTGIVVHMPSNVIVNNLKIKVQLEIGGKTEFEQFSSMPTEYTSPITYNNSIIQIKSDKEFRINYKSKAPSKEVSKVAFLSDLNTIQPKIKLQKHDTYKLIENPIVPILGTDNGITDGVFYRSVDLDKKVLTNIYRYSIKMKITSEQFPLDRTVCSSTSPYSDFTIEFLTDALEMSIAMNIDNNYCSVMCDGKLITEPFVYSNSNQYAKIVFEERKIRTIKLLCQSNSKFFGVVVDDRASIFPYNEKRIKACFDGDSIVEGAGSGNQILNSTVGVFSQIYNFDFYDNARGGTGYSNTLNGTKEKMIDRINNLVLENPDIIFIMCGLNDSSMLSNATTDIPAYFDKLEEVFPDKEVIIISPFNPREDANNIGDLVSINNLCKENALAKGYPYIDTINGSTYDKKGNMITSGLGGIIKGFGTVSSPVKGGNRSIYISGDNTHPVAEGHRFLANRIAEECYKLINS